jgi:hypothetical protein
LNAISLLDLRDYLVFLRCETEKAEVEIMFGDDKGVLGVVVKQLVPSGKAERNRKVLF